MKKKNILIILVVLFIIGSIVNLFNSNDTSKQQQTNNQQEENSNNKELKINVDYSTISPTSKDLKEALNQEFKLKDVVYDSESKTLKITFNGDSASNGRYAVKQTALKGASILKLLKDNKAIENIYYYYNMDVVDDKGNTSKENVVQAGFTREIWNSINVNTWHDLLIQKNFYTKFYTTADTFLIYPSIQKELPKEDLDNIYIK